MSRSHLNIFNFKQYKSSNNLLEYYGTVQPSP